MIWAWLHNKAEHSSEYQRTRFTRTSGDAYIIATNNLIFTRDIVGMVVGKFSLDIVIHEKDLHWQETNGAEGNAWILKRLVNYRLEHLMMEATGRYEFELAEHAAVVQPKPTPGKSRP